MNSLYNLLNEQVLTEGRKEDVMAKYPQIDKEIIENLSQNDPSGNNKYLEWMVREIAERSGNPEEILQLIGLYNTNLNLINANNLAEYKSEKGAWGDATAWARMEKSPKDINSFPTLEHLRHFTDFFSTITSKKKEKDELKKQAEKIYENDEVVVMAPKTHNASCIYGATSKWCTTSRENPQTFENYRRDGVLYYFLRKKGGRFPGNLGEKVALYWGYTGNKRTWYNQQDNGFTAWVGSPDMEWFTPDMAAAVEKHHSKDLLNRKKNDIERVLISPGFYKRSGSDGRLKNDFLTFIAENVYSPEQILSIIRNDNWLSFYENSDNGTKIRNKLGNQVVFSLFKELLESSKNIKETLKDLHSQEAFTKITKSFNDNQNRELAALIVEKNGGKPNVSESGNDTKMFVDKWTMTPEQWETYSASSSYFFVGSVKPMEVGVDKNGEPKYEKSIDIESIMKVDRFDPQHHHSLQMMMLRARFANGNLYGIVTSRDLLDDWMGKGGNEIPLEVRKAMMEKAKKIH